MNTQPSSEVTRRARRADAVRNRARVLDGARAAFVEHGIDAQMEDIARRAGVGVGTVYRHFPTKQELIDALVVEHFTGIIERTKAALEEDDPGAAFFDLLRYCFEAQNRGSMFDVLNDLAEGSSAKAAIIEELQQVTEPLMARAKAAGALRDDMCPDDIGVLMCALGAAKQAESWYPGEDPAGRFFVHVLDGLRPPAHPR